jgi:hypothetical protein
MPQDSPTSCPSCGKSASGRFCPSCGTAMAGRPCGSCGASLAPGARFCASCGAASGAVGAPAAAGGAPARPAFLPFALTGVAVVVALVVLLIPKEPAAVAALNAPFAPTPTSTEVPPLLEGLSSRDRFDTLYNRVMRASERGDEGTALQYAPQALQAYAALDLVDADARYHAAMIRLHTGDQAGAAALADTISQVEPTHLFGFVLRGTVARWQGNDGELSEQLAAFLRHYDAEMALQRVEYGHHGFILNQFVGEARGRQQ